MKRKARKGIMEFLSVCDGQELVGLAITVLYKDMVLLDYFAVNRRLRGRNYGSRALQMLKERYADRRLILEIELPEDPQAPNPQERLRRKHFYLKNGMKETGIKVCVFRVPMEVLTAGKTIDYDEYYALYEKVIGPAFARRVVRLEGEF